MPRDDHYLDVWRYAFGIQHYRTIHRPGWWRPGKRIAWVHQHGPGVPQIREKIPRPFSRLKGLV